MPPRSRNRPRGAAEPLLKASDAARALDVSLDTLRRWDREGRIHVVRDSSNRRMVARSEVERLSGHVPRHLTGTTLSARNRLAGTIRSVEADGVVALVEIDAGPFRIAAVITRDAVEELGLAPGVPAVATIKATSVMISRDDSAHH